MKTKELICICCPMGCPLTVEMDGDSIVSVSGNTCKRGEVYAVKEVSSPTRIVTSSIEVLDGDASRVSVKTKEDIPKDRIFRCVRELKGLKVKAPVHIGDVILENIADTGISIVATGDVNRM